MSAVFLSSKIFSLFPSPNNLICSNPSLHVSGKRSYVSYRCGGWLAKPAWAPYYLAHERFRKEHMLQTWPMGSHISQGGGSCCSLLRKDSLFFVRCRTMLSISLLWILRDLDVMLGLRMKTTQRKAEQEKSKALITLLGVWLPPGFVLCEGKHFIVD